MSLSLSFDIFPSACQKTNTRQFHRISNLKGSHWNVNNESEDDEDGKGVRDDGVHVK